MKDKLVYVTGGHGFLGKHLVKRLLQLGAKVFAPPKNECDLLSYGDFYHQLSKLPQVDVLYHLAADVGGIAYNKSNPGGIGHNNLKMGLNVIENSRRCNVKHFVFAGTVCSYPQYPHLPMVEGSIWYGYPEPSNGAYGVAKRTLMDILSTYRVQYNFSYATPIFANLYGPGDQHKPGKSHVIADLFQKFMEAKSVTQNSVEVWGSGRATRDFLFVEDAVDALILAGERQDVGEEYNVASGQETTVYGLAYTIKDIVGFSGDVAWDDSKPSGQERRAFHIHKVREKLGWTPKTELRAGLQQYFEWLQQGG